MALNFLSKLLRTSVNRVENPCFWSSAMALWIALSLTTYPCARYSAMIRDRGLSSCGISCSSLSAVAASVVWPSASSSIFWAASTCTDELPNWVWSRRRAVFAALYRWECMLAGVFGGESEELWRDVVVRHGAGYLTLPSQMSRWQTWEHRPRQRRA